jgi:hypothetical protein
MTDWKLTRRGYALVATLMAFAYVGVSYLESM